MDAENRPGSLHRLWRAFQPTLQYVMETEVHVYAFSIAANVLLSFWPFLLVLRSICRYVLHWPAAEEAIYYAVQDLFPGEVGVFIVRNFRSVDLRALELTSILLLLFTANGVFEPLEVALNRAWGVKQNRSYVRNQIVSMVLIFACGSLALLSIALTAVRPYVLAEQYGLIEAVNGVVRALFYKAAAVPVSISILFLVYWLLPNKRIQPRRVIVPAIFVGLALEAVKNVNLLIAPLLYEKFKREYNVFVNSVSILFWSFIASMIVLAGAELTARLEARRMGQMHDTKKLKLPAPVPAAAPESTNVPGSSE